MAMAMSGSMFAMFIAALVFIPMAPLAMMTLALMTTTIIVVAMPGLLQSSFTLMPGGMITTSVSLILCGYFIEGFGFGQYTA